MIRAATTADVPRFAALCRELGVDDPPPVHGTLLSERGSAVDGYVHYDTLSETGYVRELVVAPRARSADVGATLLRAAAAKLRAAGVTDWHLSVNADNAAAIHLYERLGFAVEHRSTVLRLPWARIDRLPSEPASAWPVAPDEDDDIERALGLLAGQIAMTRLGPDRVLRQLRDRTLAPIGFAAFDPAFPGAHPFRVARPALAATLLAALRPFARHTYLQLVADNDDALADVLVEAGAEVRLRLLHLGGPLPDGSA